MTKVVSRLLIGGLFLCVLANVSSAAGANALRLQGIYDYVVHPEQDPPVFSARYTFEVLASGCSWIISYADTSAATNPALVNVKATASCDGSNVYFVQMQSEAGLERAYGDRYAAVKTGLPAAIATIYPGAYPAAEEITLQKLWLAFSSSCVLSAPRGKAKPMTYGDLGLFYSNTNFYSYYYYTTNADNPPTRQITFTNDGYFALREQQTGKVIRARYGPPYAEGFQEGVGRWTRVTNIAGLSAPLEFEFTSFMPQFRPVSGPEFVKTASYRCVVTNVALTSISQLPAPLPMGRTLVADRRFAREGWSRIDYVATNAWLTLDDPFIAFRAENTKKSSFETEALDLLGLVPKNSQWLKHTIWVVLTFPLGLLCLKGIRRKLKTTLSKDKA